MAPFHCLRAAGAPRDSWIRDASIRISPVYSKPITSQCRAKGDSLLRLCTKVTSCIAAQVHRPRSCATTLDRPGRSAPYPPPRFAQAKAIDEAHVHLCARAMPARATVWRPPSSELKLVRHARSAPLPLAPGAKRHGLGLPQARSPDSNGRAGGGSWLNRSGRNRNRSGRNRRSRNWSSRCGF